ncbi:MAG: hypothetical protein U1E28_20430 [Beijerinckiaceae bacterium]
MSRARTLGREARQRLPDGPEAAGKADIAGIPSTKAAKPKKPYITVKPAAGGSPNDLSGIPAIVMRSLVTVTAVCVDDFQRLHLPSAIARIERAGIRISRGWLQREGRRLRAYSLVEQWEIVEASQ